jgi:hypothetical protein
LFPVLEICPIQIPGITILRKGGKTIVLLLIKITQLVQFSGWRKSAHNLCLHLELSGRAFLTQSLTYYLSSWLMRLRMLRKMLVESLIRLEEISVLLAIFAAFADVHVIIGYIRLGLNPLS